MTGGGRQPVHTLYVAADRFDAGAAAAAGAEARRLLAAHAPDPDALADATGTPPALAAEVHLRVSAKLAREAVEDVRVDFEDGYAVADGEVEDRDAQAAGRAVATALRDGVLPPYCGVRVKPFDAGTAARSERTLARFLAALLDGPARLPAGFVVTLPKVTEPGEVAAFARALDRLERAHGLDAGAVGVEVQVETPEALVGRDGRLALRGIVEAGGGRVSGAHFGVYDYTASLGLPPAQQRLDHPACDHARHLMQVSLAGTGGLFADGATNAVPAADDAAEVRRVWRRHAADVAHSLRDGFAQGWDLHPAHLVSRFAATYAFLLADLDDVCARLARWHRGRGGGVLDEPATVATLLAHLRRAVDCGAIGAREAAQRAGVDGGEALGAG